MHFRPLSVAAAGAILSSILVSSLFAQCPIYTKKTTIVGARAAVPAGWFVYCREGAPGIYKSNLTTGAAALVPNTGTDVVSSLDISEDGRWIAYLATTGSSSKIFLITVDGTGRTEMQVVADAHQSIKFPTALEFVHNSPVGTEVAYVAGSARIRAAKLTLTATTATVVSTRVLLDMTTTTDPNNQLNGWVDQSSQFSVNGDQLFSGIWIPVPPATVGPSISRFGFITIPNAGNGTATAAGIYKFLNDDYQSWYGCGLTMSRDAALCLANSNKTGSDCVPNTNQNPTMDHKGFYITKFMHASDAPILRDDIIDDPLHGISINWCPDSYRSGTYDEIDFTGWSFSNSSDYVVGVLKGSLPPATARGIWVVHVPTNTWTRVSEGNVPTTTNCASPAMFLTGIAGAAPMPAKHTAVPANVARRLTLPQATYAMPAEVSRLEILSLSGKALWSYDRGNAEGNLTRSLPTGKRLIGPVLLREIK